MKVVVDHIGGSRRGQRQEFDLGDRLRFGRHPENEVSFDAHRDLDASSRHAELRRKDGDLWLCDVGSSNGLLVGGERVTEVPVPVGETIEVEFGVGGPRVRLFVGEPDEIPEPPSASSIDMPAAKEGKGAGRRRLVAAAVVVALAVAAAIAMVARAQCVASPAPPEGSAKVTNYAALGDASRGVLSENGRDVTPGGGEL